MKVIIKNNAINFEYELVLANILQLKNANRM